jgi:hypothetical protein
VGIGEWWLRLEPAVLGAPFDGCVARVRVLLGADVDELKRRI